MMSYYSYTTRIYTRNFPVARGTSSPARPFVATGGSSAGFEVAGLAARAFQRPQLEGLEGSLHKGWVLTIKRPGFLVLLCA